MKQVLLRRFLFLLCFASLYVVAEGKTSYYAKITAKVNSISDSGTGGGRVYASTENGATSGSDTVTGENQGIDQITLYVYAVANDGFEFVGWTKKNGSEDIVDGGGATMAVTGKGSEEKNSPTDLGTYYAIFKKLPNFSFSFSAAVSGSGGGSASVSPTSASLKGEHWDTKSMSTSATYIASAPARGYYFEGWSLSNGGDVISTDFEYDATVTNSAPGTTLNYKLYACYGKYEEPQSISASNLQVRRGGTNQIDVAWTPSNSYKELQYSMVNGSGFATVDGNGVVTGLSVGTAQIKVQAVRIDGGTPESLSTIISVNVVDQCATPVAAFEVTADEKNAYVTLTTSTPNASIFYTTDGTTPTTASTQYTGPFLIAPNVVIKAFASRIGDASYIDSEVLTTRFCNRKLPAPTIKIDENGVVTFACYEDGVTFHYTTDGSNPTSASASWTTGQVGISGIPRESMIRVIATKEYWIQSTVTSMIYVGRSEISGSTVYLNDIEDHNWTYYKGVDESIDGGNYKNNYGNYGKGKYGTRIYSPNPRNVKITYNGGGVSGASSVAVSSSEPQNQFVYYETLEQIDGNWPYQVISSPFSKRPRTVGSTGVNGFFGFGGWKIVSGGEYISGKSDGETLSLDEQITFTGLPYDETNCISANIVFEATWTQATVIAGKGPAPSSFSGGTYETNFYVITGKPENSTDFAGDNQGTGMDINCTFSGLYPDGTGSQATLTNGFAFKSGRNTTIKLEYLKLNSKLAFDARGGNLILGRGITNQTPGEAVASGSKGVVNQVVKIESGNYTNFSNYLSGSNSGVDTKQWVTFGCDYDRAARDNSKLNFSGSFVGASGVNLGLNEEAEMCRVISKSGNFMTGVKIGSGDAANCYYIGVRNTHNQCFRYLEIQGGEWYANIAGGMGKGHTATKPGFTFRMRGGILRGSIYGAATFAEAGGIRTYVITGGKIGGWVAAGANGTESDEGTLDGTSYVYVGGIAEVNSHISNGPGDTKINNAVGGNVFGAGCGYSASSTSGQVLHGTNVVLADNAYVERGVYGGGGYGYCKTDQTSNIYITGGEVGGVAQGNVPGGVYGGAQQNKGGSVNIYMTGGSVLGGVYGGSNSSGTLSGGVNIIATGGRIGENTTKTANMHGGGYGASTVVTGGVNLKLGLDGAKSNADGIRIYGDAYGGGALGNINSVSNVTLNAGYIHGSIYGGALGGANAANVGGAVQVRINGGSVMNTDGTGANGSGAVYGCNNLNGTPNSTVKVDVYGTNSPAADSEYALYAVYGGGNKADFARTPTVTIHGCDNSIEYVYGGGNQAAVNSNTDVTVYGGNKIGNVFGGGNGQVAAANVGGNTNVKIYGGTIGNVYGGSNTSGTISGTINVHVSADNGCLMNIDNVYGGGNKAASNAGNLDIVCTGEGGYIGAVYAGANAANILGDKGLTLNITGGHIGNAFGGNNASGTINGPITVNIGPASGNCGEFQVDNVFGGGNMADMGSSNNIKVNINGDESTTVGNVYAGGNLASVHNAAVYLRGGNITGNVFGGGKGSKDDGYINKVMVNGNTNVYAFGGSVANIFGGNDAGGTISGTLNVHVDKNHTGDSYSGTYGALDITEAVYGGGNEADSNVGNVDITCANHIGSVFGGAKNAKVSGDINLSVGSGQIDNVYGGNNVGGTAGGNITVNILKTDGDCGNGFTVGNVFGGGYGQNTNTGGNVTVNIGKTSSPALGDATITGAVYGGSALGSVNVSNTNTTTVNLNSGKISGNVYGGGLGQAMTETEPEIAAIVKGNTVVNINPGITFDPQKDADGNYISGMVFGCNNIAGTPNSSKVVMTGGTGVGAVYGGGNLAPFTGNPEVDIHNGNVAGNVFGGGLGKSAVVVGNPVVNIGKWNANGEKDKVTVGGSVFGGGDLAAVEGKSTITVRNCSTEIGADVYGGGNAAPIYETNTTIWGGTIKGNVFGGGYGKDTSKNPKGAQVGYTRNDETAGGSGNTNTYIYGGTFGNWTGTGTEMACEDNTGGVFGGSNTNGNILGKANITIDEEFDCSEPNAQNCDLIINEAYGAGNEAAYVGTGVNFNLGCVSKLCQLYGGAKNADLGTVEHPAPVNLKITSGTFDQIFGGNNLGGVLHGDITLTIDEVGCHPVKIGELYGGGNLAEYEGSPKVNIVSCTSIGKVFGGGYGKRAVVTGNPVITIQQIPGIFAAQELGDATKLGAIGVVYGGGNQADVRGNTNVNIGNTVAILRADGTTSVSGKGANITGNVYGGGNDANVSGKTYVEIGK